MNFYQKQVSNCNHSTRCFNYLLKKETLTNAHRLLLMPDLLGYLFTGEAVTEKTNASTMQLLNLGTRKWDPDILAVLGIDTALFPRITEPGQILGELQTAQFPTYDLPKATFITIASPRHCFSSCRHTHDWQRVGIHQFRHLVVDGRGDS